MLNGFVMAQLLYWVRHLLANLGLVDFDLGCSTILPTYSASSVNFPVSQTELGIGWNSTNQSQPNLGSSGDAPPCSLFASTLMAFRISCG